MLGGSLERSPTVAVALLDQQSVRIAQLLQATAERVASRFEEIHSLNRIVRQQIDDRIAQLRADTAPLAPVTLNLVVCNHADPLHKISAQLKRLVFAPQHDTDLLKDFLRRRGTAQQ